MKILLTGATGFIGSRLCEALAGHGHLLVALSRDPVSAQKNIPQLTKAYLWAEPEKTLPPAAALDGVDAVIHLAGESVSGRWTQAKKRAIRESRILGTRHLVQQISNVKNRPKVMISASAIGYYGDRGNEALNVKSGSQSDFLAQVCQEWEREASRAKESGLRVAHVRIGVVLGPNGGALSAMLLPFKLGLGGPMGSGKQWWSWIHRDDLVGLIQFALENQLEGAINATSPNPLPQREFAKILSRVMRRPAFMPAPAFAIKLLLGEFSSELLTSKRVSPERALQAGFKFQYPELESAVREILVNN
ncbi:TIGR01777 family protein [Candidatus Acetothermia bacterium]|nr:TIGR01777 family protein [Candidatus Acetothermia bacterium]MBI3644173.1 TIGR01777 family protein [Candidatus Acetothermia bacterium]